MAYKVVAFQKVESTEENSEEEHWKTTCSLEMVTSIGGHLKAQKEWRLETRWNAAEQRQDYFCQSQSCNYGPTSIS